MYGDRLGMIQMDGCMDEDVYEDSGMYVYYQCIARQVYTCQCP